MTDKELVVRCVHCHHAVTGENPSAPRFVGWNFGCDSDTAKPNEYGTIYGVCDLCTGKGLEPPV